MIFLIATAETNTPQTYCTDAQYRTHYREYSQLSRHSMARYRDRDEEEKSRDDPFETPTPDMQKRVCQLLYSVVFLLFSQSTLSARY